jgi:hypothetical protein
MQRSKPTRELTTAILVVIAAVAFGVTCGGGDGPGPGAVADAGGGAPGAGPAVAKCGELVAAICTRLVECDGDPDRSRDEAKRRDCEAALRLSAGCDRAVMVSASFDRCVADLRAGTCATIAPGGRLAAPASCTGVLLIAPTDAQSKCLTLLETLCGRIVSCEMPPDPAAQRRACVTALMRSSPCSSAESIGPTYPQCIAKLESSTCATLLPTSGSIALPTECNRVIVGSGGAGGMMGGTGGAGGGADAGTGGAGAPKPPVTLPGMSTFAAVR